MTKGGILEIFSLMSKIGETINVISFQDEVKIPNEDKHHRLTLPFQNIVI